MMTFLELAKATVRQLHDKPLTPQEAAAYRAAMAIIYADMLKHLENAS